MELIEEREFAHNGLTFHIRMYRASDGFKVAALLDGQQVSPWYSVSFETNADYFWAKQESLRGHLFDYAMSDLEVGMYFKPAGKNAEGT